jgi:membrane fusion protein (multidrug efflux system)
LIDYDPDRIPLFAGLSVTPYVYFREPLMGDDPGKGKTLQPFQPRGGKS